jgi:iron complex transport system substrate-binding protein
LKNLLSLVIFIFFSCPLAQARVVEDATRLKTTLIAHPSRIVTLAPNLAEIAASLLGENLEKIVGVSEYTDFPAALHGVKSIGPYSRFNLEEVVALKPDLVLANWNGNSKDQVDHLRELNVPVVVVKTDHLDDIGAAIRLIAESMNVPEAGKRVAERFETDLKMVEQSSAKTRSTPPRVLLQLDTDPLVVAGKGSFLSDALEKIGAQNIYADSATSYPRPSMEDAVSRNPDVIIFLNMKKGENLTALWQRFSALKAVKEGKVLFLHSDEIVRPSPRVIQGLIALQKAVYGK